MYSQIVSLLFPIYATGCIAALFLSWNKRAFYLAFAYSYLLIVFQFIAWGNGSGWGYKMFIASAAVQLIMCFCAWRLSVRASKVIVLASLAAVFLNLIAMTAFLLSHPIRQIYFIGMNTVQILEIGSLIVFAPLWPFLWKQRRFLPKRSKPWTHQMVVSGRASGPIC